MKRRYFLKISTFLGLSGIASHKVFPEPKKEVTARKPTPLEATPSDIEGPFYPLGAQADMDFDLTGIAGKDGVAQGTQVYIEGKVVDVSGQSIKGALVDIWQANSHGRYRHPNDSSKAPLDENFQGWAIVNTGSSGEFRFKTVMPGAYQAFGDWQRPPHIHFKVGKQGYSELVTQMYFPGQKLNDLDRLLQGKSSREQALMIAQESDQEKNSLAVYQYKIVLKPV